MIDKEGNARIMDFGIARSIMGKGITGAGVMVGTPEYMSPEQAEMKEVDQRSDIYSLGVILYEMVTGRVPFEGETPLGIAMKHKSEMPKDPKELNTQVPSDLSRVILKCMEKSKEKRFQSAGELRSELTMIEKGIPTTERKIPERKPLTSKEITVTIGLRKLFIPALVVVALVIATLIILQLIPQKEAVIAPKIENSIAVISFENQTGDDAYDYLQKVIPNLLITNLENTGLFHVVTWERMHDLLKQIGKNDVETIDGDLGFEVCRLEGIRAIVLGFFTKAGDVFNTDIKVLDTETKKILKSYISKGEGVESILKTQIDELSKEISQSISREKIEASQVQISEITTTSMEAYNYFLDGSKAQEDLYLDGARKLFEKAIKLDPTFAFAHLRLGQVYGTLGYEAAKIEAFKKAKIFSDKSTDKEKLYIEAYYAGVIEGNPEKRFRILKQIAGKYPREKLGYELLGDYYWAYNMHQEAIEEYSKVLELDPNYGPVFNKIGIMYTKLRNFEKAVEYFDKYIAASPGTANPLDSKGYVFFRMGKLDDAITKFKEALEVKPDFSWSLRSISYVYALKEDYPEAIKWADQYIERTTSLGWKAEGYLWRGFYHFWLGNFDQSMSDLHRATDLSDEASNETLIILAEFLRGAIYYYRGDFNLARKHSEIWFNLVKGSQTASLPYFSAVYNWSLGLFDLKEGRIPSAKKRLNEIRSFLQELDSEEVTTIYDILAGEIWLEESSFDKAIDILKKKSILRTDIIRIGLMARANIFNNEATLARAYQQKGEIDNAIGEYEKRIKFDPNSDDRCLIHPLNYYRLARLYEQQGNKIKAIDHYSKFLDLWKDADSGIAEVGDAKKRLAGVKE